MSPTLSWLSLWFLLLLALAPSAFGRGWFLQCTPQRLMVLLALPLALLTAHGLDGWPARPRRLLLGMLLSAGLCSMAIGALFFQGPLFRTPGKGPFAYLHYELMRPADAQLLAQLPPGNVLVPPWRPIAFGEIVSLQPGVQMLGGPGAMNLGDQPFDALQPEIERFFSPETASDFRKEFLRRWCVNYIYCPDTCPLDERILGALSRVPQLELMAQSGQGRLWRVKLD